LEIQLAFWKWISGFARFHAVFPTSRVNDFRSFSPEILSKVFPECTEHSKNLISGALLKWS
ncbi:hypothetical protein NE470_13295, partial [Faecalibacterium prausnitzii]|uniref:hypothetical protein n=1 Tax=Faecalibacterium prausnitzii TaxID=853 RepID=UPI00210CDAC9